MEKFVLIPHSMWEKWENSPKSISKEVSLRPKVLEAPSIPRTQAPDSLKYDQYTTLSHTLSRTSPKFVQILDKIVADERVSLSQDGTLLLDGTDTRITANNFIRVVGQPKLQDANRQRKVPKDYWPIIETLQLSADLQTNPNASKTPSGAWSNFSF